MKPKLPKQNVVPGTKEMMVELMTAIELVEEVDLGDSPYLARQLSVFVTCNNYGVGHRILSQMVTRDKGLYCFGPPGG